MKIKLNILLFFTISALTFAQKQSLRIADFGKWNRIENRQISNDGKFVAYEVNQQKGDGFLVIYNAETQKTDTIKHGTKAKFSAFSNYVVLNIRIPDDSLRKLKLAKTSKEKMPKEALGVYNLTSGYLNKIENIKSYQLPEEKSNWLAYLQEIKQQKKDSVIQKTDSIPATKTKSTVKKDKQQLVVWEPVKDIKHTFNQVDSFAIASKGTQLAYFTKPIDSTKLRALVVFHPEILKSDTLCKDSMSIQKLTFDEAGLQLAYLTSKDTAANKNFALHYYNFKKKTSIKIVDSLTVGMPRNWSPSINGDITFSKDGSKIYLGTAPKVYPAKKDSVLDEEKPKLDLWSYTDDIIQPRQLKMLPQKKKQSYQGVFIIGDNKYTQLADTAIETIRYYNFRNADYALGIDKKNYERNVTWSNTSLHDYYLIDLKTGKRTCIVNGKNNLSLSPKTQYAIYYDYADSSYYSIDLKKFNTTALTAKIPVKFFDELNDMPSDPEPYGIAGWTANDKYVLIYDRFDIWKVDPAAREIPVNLTKGRGQTERFRYIALDPEIDYIPEKMILSCFNETSNAEAYVEYLMNKTAVPQKLIEGNFMLTLLQKAKNANAVIWSSQTVSDFPEVRISDISFKTSLQISKANPQQSIFIWPEVEKVSWISFAGDTLKGLLYKPDNFNPEKKYPMMVYFYEKSSNTEHRYNYPQPSRSIISIPFYVSNEYLVFVPDINYCTGYPGKDAYNAIVSGVYHLTDTRSYIDSKHIALQGQSWGGYQIAYLVTQTDMFAAAMAGAPVSNMTSAYGGIRWGTGMSRMFQYEESQSRIGGTLWEKPLHYIENSPLFHAPKVKTPLLIMANDNDGAVPWYQGIEYFMALYRLGKPVWMINYNGMEHNIEDKYWANRIDLSTRMFGFFNHYLKGMPAPEWMKKGIPAIEKGEKTGY